MPLSSGDIRQTLDRRLRLLRPGHSPCCEHPGDISSRGTGAEGACPIQANIAFRQGSSCLAFYDWNGSRCEVAISELPAEPSAAPKPVARFTSEVTKENAGCMAAAIEPRLI